MLDFIKEKKIMLLQAFFCAVLAISLAACSQSGVRGNIEKTPFTGPTETAEASLPPEVSVDYQADEPETNEPTSFSD